MQVSLWLIAVVFSSAYNNGANDNFKGVATLFGSGATSYHGALWWATVTTLAGSCAALLLSGQLVAAFSEVRTLLTRRKRRRKSSVGRRRWSNEYRYEVLGLFWDWKIQPLAGAGRYP